MTLKVDLRNAPFFEEIREVGREEGRDNGHIDAVLNMRRKTGASAEIIADTLDFDLEWVKKILAEHKG